MDKLFTLTEARNFLRKFKENKIDYKSYYTHILLGNGQKFQFKNPNLCKDSFKNYIGHHVQHAIFKRLIKQGYRFAQYYKGEFDCMFLELVKKGE